MKFCPYCGAGLDEDMRFCPSCGKPFESGKANPHLAGKAASEPTPTAEVAAAPVQAATPVQTAPAPKKKTGLIAIIAVVVVLAIVGGLFASGAFAPKEPEPTPEPVIPFSDDTAAIAAASESVVMLSCYDKDGELFATGSGFAAFEDGVIVTNYHVIEGEVFHVKAETESGRSFDCPTMLAWDADKDIAILKADRRTDLALLTPGDSGNLQKGEKVVAIGSPLGLMNSVSTGVFSGYIDDKLGQVLQFTAAISHGSSGGALFNDAGEVIGITFASLTAGQSLNLAVPMAEVQYLYDGASPAKAVSMEAFYDTFDHTPPLPTYTVGYVLEHYEELDGQEFFMEGYIYSIYEMKDSSLGYEDGTYLSLINQKDIANGYNSFKENVTDSMLFVESALLRAFHIVSVPFEGQMLDWLKVKDKVSVLCQLSVQEGIEYGSKLNFIPYDIAVIEE